MTHSLDIEIDDKYSHHQQKIEVIELIEMQYSDLPLNEYIWNII